MIAYHIVEFLIVAGAVGFSGWNLARRFLPQRGTATKSGGCSSCDACGSCSTPPSPTGRTEQPLHFHR
ncbi:hypothetical protein [Solimonas terrae]|uniref:FeoB-associated Cys-rich membrane protein n=1 Tax=Solimonas terrae TaxID=1396819 RepID=A0A6M2BR05_9GAMM|nr:hypothetical protein [Solimonas terrae]NGY04467.1 hypothetical protein [Solimonas terrae]